VRSPDLARIGERVECEIGIAAREGAAVAGDV
jgi:hypothetical protein